MSTLDRALRSIGKANYVKYFEDYKAVAEGNKKISAADKMALADKLLQTNPNASKISGQLIRISSAIYIFRKGWQYEALKEVINSKHPSITESLKKQAAGLIGS